jgi:transcriptional/translational regulatory protein YebC/TACO1
MPNSWRLMMEAEAFHLKNKSAFSTYGIISDNVSNGGGIPKMGDELKSAANWAKELGLPDKKIKDAIKAAKVEPDAKKGCCSYYSKASVTKAMKSVK